MNRLRAWAPAFAAGLIHASLIALAFPPFSFWGCVFLAPLPLVWAATRRRQPTLLPVWLGVLPLWAYEMSWVWNVSIAGYVPMIAALALFAALFVALLRAVSTRLPGLPLSLLVPVLWTGLEFFRGEIVCHGFPWMMLAHPTIDAPMLPWTAAALGTYFTSFLVAAFSGAAADSFLAAPRRRRTATIALAAASLAVLGAFAIARRTPNPSPRHLRVAVVQTNIPQDNKMDWTIEQRLLDWERFEALTRQAATARPAPHLIVWPETMFPGEALDADSVRAQRDAGLAWPATRPDSDEDPLPLSHFADRLLRLQADIGVPMLVGALAMTNLRFVENDGGGFHAEYDARYNSAFLIVSGALDPARYDKIELTPFGEVMPYVSAWPWLQRQVLALGASGMSFDLAPGRTRTVFEVNGDDGRPVRFVTPICFEATSASLCRTLSRSAPGGRADLIINLTNDGWFGAFDPGRRQHLQIARWRSAELDLPLIRAANTGASAVIEPPGRTAAPRAPAALMPLRTDGLLSAAIAVGGSESTIYALIGDVFGWLALAATGGLAAVSVVIGRRSRTSGAMPTTAD
ncbi:MAG: apolipoprotein N-acyltransferase [Phycisphaerales bacterium]